VEQNKFSDLFSEEIIAQTTVTDFEKQIVYPSFLGDMNWAYHGANRDES